MDLEKKDDLSLDPKNELSDNKKPSDNIFSELSGELDFGNDKEEIITSIKKDKIYYLKLSGLIFSILNVALFIFLVIGYSFVKIQNNTSFYNKSFLDPLCIVLLSDDMKNTGDYCSSVASLLVDYDQKTSNLKNEISKKLGSIINNIYIIENFVNSKEVSFLLDNKNNRLNVLNILNEFDNLKNNFSGGDKKMIDCSSIKISSEGFLDIECNVYSTSWETGDDDGKGIIGYSGNKTSSTIQGTSITIAASFLNFIQNNPEYNFQLIEKQKDFSSESIAGDNTFYVKATNIKFKLKYNNLKNNLSL